MKGRLLNTMSAITVGGLAAAGFLTLAAPAQAVTVYTSLSAWKTAVGSYAETTSYGPDLTNITSFVTTDGVQVTAAETVFNFPDDWGIWTPGYTGQVLNKNTTNSITFGLGKAVSGFGFFAEPDQNVVEDITLTTSDSSVLTRTVDGSVGPLFFGWTGAGVTGFTISSTTDNSAGDFGVGDVFTASAPEPFSWALMLVGFGCVGAAIRRYRALSPKTSA
jgi:hypothetical protein